MALIKNAMTQSDLLIVFDAAAAIAAANDTVGRKLSAEKLTAVYREQITERR